MNLISKPLFYLSGRFINTLQIIGSSLTSTDAPYKRVDTCATNRVQGSVAVILG
mgnify:CR=1 FL=1